jgi:hypothetical protein
MNNANPEAVAECAMAVIDAVQTRREAVRPLGVAAALLLVAERLGVEPQDIATVARNLMLSPSGQRIPEFRAVAEYVRNEVPR